MGQPATVFHTVPGQRIAIRQSHCARIEDAVDRVGPNVSTEDRVFRMTIERSKLRIVVARLATCRVGAWQCGGKEEWESKANAHFLVPMAASRRFHGLHFQQSHEKREGRFRPLIFVDAIRMQSIPAPSGHGIVEWNLQVVLPRNHKPLEPIGTNTCPSSGCCSATSRFRDSHPTAIILLFLPIHPARMSACDKRALE